MFPALNDNYGYLLHDAENKLTAAIDTPDAAAIIAQCDKLGVRLTHIFNTHHHFDHVGGNAELKEKFGVTIVGPEQDRDRIEGIDIGLSDGEKYQFGKYEITTHSTPGHTTGHCIYHIPALHSAFVGDTVFALGCGRLFEGTPQDMFDSFAKIKTLPDETKLYCAHEYTLSNGVFAQSLDPDNAVLNAYMEVAKSLRKLNKPTIPTKLAFEKSLNPFMRAKTAKEFGEIRALKDNF